MRCVKAGLSRSSVLGDGVQFLMQRGASLIASHGLGLLFALFISTLVSGVVFSDLCSGQAFGIASRRRQIKFFAGVKSEAALMIA